MSFLDLVDVVEVGLFKAGSVGSRAVSVDDLDADDDLLKSTGCVCCCTTSLA